MNDDKNIDWIIDYFNDELNKAERNIIEQKIEQDPDLQSEFEFIRTLLSDYERLTINELEIIPELNLNANLSYIGENILQGAQKLAQTSTNTISYRFKIS